MDKFEIYSLLFTDSFTSSLVFTTNKEVMLYSARIFGSVSSEMLLVISVLANFVANIINYFFGKVLFNIFNNIRDPEHEVARNIRMLKLLKYKNLFLLLSAIPFFGKFMIVMAGFGKFSIFRTLLICTILKICYYVLVIWEILAYF